MAVIELFGCNPLSMGGIKTLKLSTMDINNNPLVFPLDVTLNDGSNSTIILQEDVVNEIIIIGGVEIQYRTVYPYNANFVEDEVNERQGRYYSKSLTWEMPKINLITNNQLKNFLFSSNGEFAISSMVCFITDMNDNNWIIGYDSPLILKSMVLSTEISGGDNRYSLNYLSNSYNRIRQYVVS